MKYIFSIFLILTMMSNVAVSVVEQLQGRDLVEVNEYSKDDTEEEGKKEKVEEQKAPVKSESPDAAEAIQNLALVGISWSSNPDAIVEDKAAQRTFFVKRGQMVGDAIKVEAIFKDHVVVVYEDKEYEIR